MKDTVRIHISLPLELKLQLRSMAGSYDMSLNVLITWRLYHCRAERKGGLAMKTHPFKVMWIWLEERYIVCQPDKGYALIIGEPTWFHTRKAAQEYADFLNKKHGLYSID